DRTSRSLRAAASRTSASSRAGLSPTTCWCSTVMPSSASSRLKNWALVFTISPSSSSVPTQMISATTVIASFAVRPGSEIRFLADGHNNLFRRLRRRLFQRLQLRHGGLGGFDLGQSRPGLGVGRGEDGAAVLV